MLVTTVFGTVQPARRRATPPLVVGDWIDADTIVDLLPRASLLQRRDLSTGSGQPIAPDVDVVDIARAELRSDPAAPQWADCWRSRLYRDAQWAKEARR